MVALASLTAGDRAELERELAECRRKRAACLAAMETKPWMRWKLAWQLGSLAVWIARYEMELEAL